MDSARWFGKMIGAGSLVVVLTACTSPTGQESTGVPSPGGRSSATHSAALVRGDEPTSTLTILEKSMTREVSADGASDRVGFRPKLPAAFEQDGAVAYFSDSRQGGENDRPCEIHSFVALYDGETVASSTHWGGLISDSDEFEREIRGSLPPGMPVTELYIDGHRVLAWDRALQRSVDPDTGRIVSGYNVPSSQVTWWEGDGVSYSITSHTLGAKELLALVSTME